MTLTFSLHIQFFATPGVMTKWELSGVSFHGVYFNPFPLAVIGPRRRGKQRGKTKGDNLDWPSVRFSILSPLSE